jgi:hypothetical protein
VVILIIPEVSAAGEPSLEFNQSSYEINDTVEVKLSNIGPIPHNQIIVSLFSDEENSTYITEKLHNEGNTSYITQDTVSKLLSSSNQTNISKEDIIYTNNGDSSGQINYISINNNHTANIYLKNPIDDDDSIMYRSEEYIIARISGQNYTGNISLSHVNENGKLKISKPGNITAEFVHPLSGKKYNNSVPVKNRSEINESLQPNLETNSNHSSGVNSTPNPTPEPTPSADDSRVLRRSH